MLTSVDERRAKGDDLVVLEGDVGNSVHEVNSILCENQNRELKNIIALTWTCLT